MLYSGCSEGGAMSKLPGRVVGASVLLLLVTSAFAGSVSITGCRQNVPPGMTGVLANDLDCTGDPLAVAVSMSGGGKLLLAGHSITGAEIAVACSQRCTVYGPGTITGNGEGIDQLGDGSLTVRDVTVTGNSEIGLGGDRVKVTNSTVNGNGGIVFDGHPSGGGIKSRDRVSLRGSTVDGNVTYGVCAGKIKVGASMVQANGTDPACDAGTSCGACGDLVGSVKPSVKRTSTCNHSVQPPSGRRL
jgi:hypothetical protein